MSAHVLDRLSMYLDGELAEAARAEVELHLRGCAACARHLEELRHLIACQGIDLGFCCVRHPQVPAEAKRRGVPAYVIFHDSTLEALAVVRPRDRGALGTVRGVGPAKMEEYAEDLLKMLARSPSEA